TARQASSKRWQTASTRSCTDGGVSSLDQDSGSFMAALLFPEGTDPPRPAGHGPLRPDQPGGALGVRITSPFANGNFPRSPRKENKKMPGGPRSARPTGSATEARAHSASDIEPFPFVVTHVSHGAAPQ